MKLALEFNIDDCKSHISKILNEVTKQIKKGKTNGSIYNLTRKKIGKFWIGRDD